MFSLSPFPLCAMLEGTHGDRVAGDNTRCSHRKVSPICYATRSRAKRIPARPFTCTARQARRSLRSSPCDSSFVFERADSVYKNALNKYTSSSALKGSPPCGSSSDFGWADSVYKNALNKYTSSSTLATVVALRLQFRLRKGTLLV